jgi:hypothetical protein
VLALSELAGEAYIGRDEDCAASLAGQDVSRRHAVLRAQGPHRILTDLDSRNGTWVNGRRVRSVVLSDGDVVRVGGWVGVVTRSAGPFGALAPGLFGGEALRRALGAAEAAARSDLPIVLEGETGTGKEAVAKAIHAWSGRRGPLVAVNCAALPEPLAEGELFGYRRGAFTGAEQASPGHFRAAQHGTLLLDEICELPLPLQAKLLRVLEEREVQPLGEARPVKLDVRVLTAAQRSLAQAVAEGEFRADLYARLDGLTLKLPPLRQRKADVPYLFARLLLSASGATGPSTFESWRSSSNACWCFTAASPSSKRSTCRSGSLASRASPRRTSGAKSPQWRRRVRWPTPSRRTFPVCSRRSARRAATSHARPRHWAFRGSAPTGSCSSTPRCRSPTCATRRSHDRRRERG